VPLILADQDLLAARTKLIELQRQTSTSLARLHRAVGGPGAAPSRSATQPTHEPQAASFPTP
jgi:outer membrane protein TolC